MKVDLRGLPIYPDLQETGLRFVNSSTPFSCPYIWEFLHNQISKGYKPHVPLK